MYHQLKFFFCSNAAVFTVKNHIVYGNEMKAKNLTKVKEKTISLTASLRNFSDESVHKPGEVRAISDVNLEKGSVIKFIVGAYYGNGNTEDNKGYVSLAFNCQVPLIFKKHHNFNFSCEVAVKDAAGNKRFVRTFTFPYDAASENAGDDLVAVYTIGRYIARETLLDDRDNLLPDDRLTLNVDINLQTLSSIDNSADIESAINNSFEIKEDSEGPIIVLNLNSELAKRLYEASSVFRALCDIPMLERSTGSVDLLDDDIKDFTNAAKIIMGAKMITFDSFDEIINLYILADKYDIQNVIRACRKFCESVLYVENSWGSFDLVEERVVKISELASFFSDDILKEIVDRLLRNGKDGAIETRRKCEHRYLSLSNVVCEYHGESPYLYFDLEEENDGDRSEFEFYY